MSNDLRSSDKDVLGLREANLIDFFHANPNTV